MQNKTLQQFPLDLSTKTSRALVSVHTDTSFKLLTLYHNAFLKEFFLCFIKDLKKNFPILT